MRQLAIVFLVLTIPVETIYAWRQGLIDPYYGLKVAGWGLLVAGLRLLDRRRARAWPAGCGMGLARGKLLARARRPGRPTGGRPNAQARTG